MDGIKDELTVNMHQLKTEMSGQMKQMMEMVTKLVEKEDTVSYKIDTLDEEITFIKEGNDGKV